MSKEKKPETGKRTTITINISPEDRKAIKVYAAENDTTISALISLWINEHCKKK